MRALSSVLVVFGCLIVQGAQGQAPYRIGNTEKPGPISLPLRDGANVTPADRQLIAAKAGAITRAAAFYGFDVDASWRYEQAVCPLAPGHILLRYSNNEPERLSSFTAVVPRGSGPVRIVPLVRDGTAPFVMPWSEHSYEVFNAITAGNGGLRQKNLDLDSGDAFLWGLCYVALVGEPGVVSRPDRELPVFDATEPTLRVGTAGDVGLAFTVRDDVADYSVWRLAFSAGGLLVHAERERHEIRELGIETAVADGGGKVDALPAGSAPAASSRTQVEQGKVVPDGPPLVERPVPDSAPASHAVPGTDKTEAPLTPKD